MECDSARLDGPLFFGSPRPYPTICRLWVARSSSGSRVARRLPGRHSLVVAGPLRCGLVFVAGRRTSGRPPPWCLKVVFCPQAHAGHFGGLVGTATPLRGIDGPGPVRASAHLSQVLVGAGVTPVVHSHGPAPLAPVVADDLKGAHGRVNSDRAVDCSRCEADQTSGTASPRGSLACLSSQVPRRRALLVSYGQQEVRLVGSGALRIRARITRPGSTSRTRDHASGRPHPVPLANNVDVPLAARFCAVAPFGQRVQTHYPYKVLGIHGWPLTRDHHAGMGADHSVSRGSGRAGPL